MATPLAHILPMKGKVGEAWLALTPPLVPSSIHTLYISVASNQFIYRRFKNGGFQVTGFTALLRYDNLSVAVKVTVKQRLGHLFTCPKCY